MSVCVVVQESREMISRQLLTDFANQLKEILSDPDLFKVSFLKTII